MSLPVPTVGVESGPDWATDINACMTQIDSHNHTSGAGVQVPTTGLNINADLTFAGYNATNLKSARFTAQTSPLSSGADLGCAYVSGVDFYYNDVNGNQIRLTQAGSIAGAPGSIAGLLSPASATYVAGNSTFVWQSGVTIPANMDMGSAILRNISAGSKGMTIAPPAAMVADTTVTFPSIPAAKAFLAMDNAGTITAEPAFANGLTTSNIAVGGILNASIASANLTGDRFIAGQQIARTSIAKTTSTIISLTDSLVLCGSGTASVTLFDPTLNPGYTVQIKKTFSSIDPVAIVGSSSFSSSIITENEVLTLQSATSGWIIVNRDYPRGWINAGASGNTFTATSSNPTKGSVTLDVIWYRREGNSMFVRTQYKQLTAGATGSGAYLQRIPGGWSIDPTYVNLDTNTSAGGQRLNNIVGNGYIATNTDYSINMIYVAYDSTRVSTWLYSASGTGAFWGSGFLSLGSTELVCNGNYQIPIVGWQS